MRTKKGTPSVASFFMKAVLDQKERVSEDGSYYPSSDVNNGRCVYFVYYHPKYIYKLRLYIYRQHESDIK